MLNSCWIDPNGIIHKVSKHKHAQFAQKTLNLPCGIGMNESIVKLSRKGWLHIGPAPFISTTRFNDLSEKQRTSLFFVLHNSDGLIKQNILSYIHE